MSGYRTTHWPSCNVALKTWGSLTIWLAKRMQWFFAASGKRGRSPKFSDAAIQFCLTIKHLFGLLLGQTIGVVKSLLHLSGLHWPASDFSTVCRRQHSLQVQVPLDTVRQWTALVCGLHRHQVPGRR